MPLYSYVALNQAGTTVKGKMIAVNEIDLEERMRALGMDLVRYKQTKSAKGGFHGRVKVRDLIVFCVHLEQLDKAGVPLLDSLADLRDSTESTKLRDLLSDVYEQVKGGLVLSEALSKYPKVFDVVFIGLVKAGEQTGNLSETFAQLGQHLKWNEALRNKVKKSIRYPIALLVLMSGVITVMMLFVVPQLSNFLVSQGFELPIHTRALIATSEIFVHFWYIILGIPVLFIMLIRLGCRYSESFAYQVDKIMLKMPFIGSVILKANLSRFVHFFTITFTSGIEVLECLQTAQNVVKNRVMREAIQTVRQNVSDGNSITLSLTATNKFPSLVLRMFKVGEESGNMEDALENINYFYDREVNDAVESIVGTIQPALIIVMGLLLFWVTSAVFGPLYDSFSKMDF
ncbi:MAG: type II secretion system F family protein [Proteobacteria bacterium]|nr:type II secretion system F family protein [Pseudomonadota bacterium]